MTWYTYVYLPLGALFRVIWYRDRGAFIRDEASQIIYLGCILGKLFYKAPNLVKIGRFSFKNGILKGGKLGKKIGVEKVKIFEVRQAHPRTILMEVTTRGIKSW